MNQRQVDSSISRLNLSEITLDREIQPRSQLNEAVIAKYSEAMQVGDQFPPVVVFYDGSKYWLADGFHRVQAKKAIGGRKILAKVISGGRRNAILYSVGANRTHGLSLCNADKYKFFDKVLYDNKRSTLVPSGKTQDYKRSRRRQKCTKQYQKPLLNIS